MATLPNVLTDSHDPPAPSPPQDPPRKPQELDVEQLLIAPIGELSPRPHLFVRRVPSDGDGFLIMLQRCSCAQAQLPSTRRSRITAHRRTMGMSMKACRPGVHPLSRSSLSRSCPKYLKFKGPRKMRKVSLQNKNGYPEPLFLSRAQLALSPLLASFSRETIPIGS